ncbi:NIPSNAP family containing protein [Xaviernesmea oryzae]|uniref:NIPSNAP family containing protein n=1 Tax=Xaviernesmea oryzae TaxID=464029 RepID=A0A1Q9AT64_9HYPH|nr:NIPSNAP family protein [Xaviernesmea oryzae]OLP58622.1 NIPSNAP family containing protein [Xaviernesmea oryzae]SEK64604.1 hypothetical protein SAMN04487976_103193 [Xaviernesmea oryzae]
MSRVIEILSYRLKPGTGQDFFEIMSTVSVPLHQGQGIDVVWHGRSLDHEDGYGLIRAFADLDTLEAQQAVFYASEAWRAGPREAIIARIDTSAKLVLSVSHAAIEALRCQGASAAIG